MTELVGDDVELAFEPHDQRAVEVYWRGAWLCTALPHDALSEAEQQRILAERRAFAGDLRRRQRRARRQARERLAPATAEQPDPPAVTRLPAAAKVVRGRGAPREEALRAAARTDLLLPDGGPLARERDRCADGASLPRSRGCRDVGDRVLPSRPARGGRRRRRRRDGGPARRRGVGQDLRGRGRARRAAAAAPVGVIPVAPDATADRRHTAGSDHRPRDALDRFAIIRHLVELLTERPAIVVIDESQLLTSDCIELLRCLHDHRTTRFALVLVGGNGTWRVLSREPMLASRVYRRVRFQPLTRAEVLAAMPAYHPPSAHAEPELIRLIDELFAHGNLRNWAAFTDTALRLGRDVDHDELDERLTRNVFALHGGADR